MLKSYTSLFINIISIIIIIMINITVIRYLDYQVEHGYRMAAPQGCAPALYDIMLECWHKVAYQTFNFLDVNQFFQQP